MGKLPYRESEVSSTGAKALEYVKQIGRHLNGFRGSHQKTVLSAGTRWRWEELQVRRGGYVAYVIRKSTGVMGKETEGTKG